MLLLFPHVLPGQSRDEYRTQILRYLSDERISQALVTAASASRDYPETPLFQLAGNKPDLAGLLAPNVTPEQAREGRDDLMEYADILLKMGNEYAEAGISLYKDLARFNSGDEDPRDEEIIYRYARHLYRSGDPQDRSKAAELVSSLAPGSGREGAISGLPEFKSILDLIDSGESPAPERFLSDYPGFSGEAAILEGLAENALRSRSCADARSYLDMALEEDPWDPELHRLQSEAFTCLGKEGEAGDAKKEALRLTRCREAFDGLLNALRDGQREEAKSGLEMILAEAPGYLDAVKTLARLYAWEGDRAKAVEVYRGYLELYPEDIRIRKIAAGMLLDEGLYNDAVLLLDGFAENETRQLAGAYRMISRGNCSAAEEFLRTAMDHNPLDSLLLIQLSRCLVTRNEFSEARSLLEKGMAANPGNPGLTAALQDIEFEYARHLSETGRRRESIAAYRRLVEIDPENAEYLLNLGYEEMMNGEYERASAHFRKGLQISPGEDWARSALAYSLMNEWKFEEAEEEMKALISRSDNPDYLLQLGSIYNQTGNTREGWALIRKAAREGQPEAARLVKERYGDE